jgi:hypothetical protein
MPAAKKSLSSSKPDGSGGAGGTSPFVRLLKNGRPPENDKSPQLEVLRFNWSEVDSQNTICSDRRRRIPQIIAQFPNGVEVTIFGSHYKTKKDFEVTHLIHKSRDVSLKPYLPWEPGYKWKSEYPHTPHSPPKWEFMVLFSGTWDVSYSTARKFTGQIYKDALQRSEKGTWVLPDGELIAAFKFLRQLAQCTMDPKPLEHSWTLERLRGYDFLQNGLWNGLLPALMKGRFSEIERAFEFARDVESKRGSEEFFLIEDHFPFAVTPYKKGLAGVCKEMRNQTKPTPPSVDELLEFMDKNDLLGPRSVSGTKFRENLKKLGLGWLIESRKK